MRRGFSTCGQVRLGDDFRDVLNPGPPDDNAGWTGGDRSPCAGICRGLERYTEHMAAMAGQYLDEGKKIAAAAGVECDLAHVGMSIRIERLSTLLRNEAVTRSKWRRTDDAGYQLYCSVVKR